MKKKLGDNALQTLEKIVALMEVTHDPNRLNELEDLRVALTRQIAALVDISVAAESQEYQAAIAGLNEATDSVEKAIQGLESIAKAIATVAQAVQLVATVAAAA